MKNNIIICFSNLKCVLIYDDVNGDVKNCVVHDVVEWRRDGENERQAFV